MEAVESAIFQEVAWRGPLKFEDLMDRLPAYGWNQVFAAVDRLSRDNRLSLKRVDRNTYVVRLGPRWEDQRINGIERCAVWKSEAGDARKGASMLCSQCYVTMTEERAYDFSVDAEQYLLKSWRCGRCDGQIEEIVTGPTRGLAAKRMQYCVRPWQTPVGVSAA